MVRGSLFGLLAVFLFGAVVVRYYMWMNGSDADVYGEIFEEEDNEEV